jgi:hypothetical protein
VGFPTTRFGMNGVAPERHVVSMTHLSLSPAAGALRRISDACRARTGRGLLADAALGAEVHVREGLAAASAWMLRTGLPTLRLGIGMLYLRLALVAGIVHGWTGNVNRSRWLRARWADLALFAGAGVVTAAIGWIIGRG